MADVKRLRSGIRRRQQVFPRQQFVVLVRNSGIAEPRGFCLRKRSVMPLRATRNSQPVAWSAYRCRRRSEINIVVGFQ